MSNNTQYMINALEYYKKRAKEITEGGGYISKVNVALEGYDYDIDWLWEDYKPEEYKMLTADENIYVEPDGTLLHSITLLMKRR